MVNDEHRLAGGNPVVTDYLSALVDRSKAILGSNTAGVYAAGSLALDSYEQGRSDIDIAIACSAPVERGSKERLVAALRHESLPCPARGLELVVYTIAVAAAGTTDPGFEMELNTGSRMDFRATYAAADRPAQDGLFWYAIDRSILAEHGRALVGPPAAEVFVAVPDTDLLDLLIASLRWHLGWHFGPEPVGNAADDEPAAWTDDAVLNACRALRRVRTGHWFAKRAAGQQVVHIEEPSPELSEVVQQALDARSGGVTPSVRAARGFQRAVLAQLQRVQSAAPGGRESAAGR